MLLMLIEAAASGQARALFQPPPPPSLDPVSFWAAFGAIATFLGSVAAALAAHASFRAVRESHMATQATLLSELLAEYSLPKMKNALRILGTHRETYGEDFVAAQRRHLEKHWPSGARVDEARRYLSHYFFRAFRLRSGQYIDEKFFNQVAELDGVGILLNVCEGLAADLHPEYNEAFFDAYRIRWADRKDEHRIRPLPPSSPVSSRIAAGLRLIRRLERLETFLPFLQRDIADKMYMVVHHGVMGRIDYIEKLSAIEPLEPTLEMLRDHNLEQEVRKALDLKDSLFRIRRGIGPVDLLPPPGTDPPFNFELKSFGDGLLDRANNIRVLLRQLREFAGVVNTRTDS